MEGVPPEHLQGKLGWFLKIDFNLVAVALVLAFQRDDAGVRKLVRELAPEIAALGYQLPTRSNLAWLCEYLRTLWPTFEHNPVVQQWLQRGQEIEEGLSHANN